MKNDRQMQAIAEIKKGERESVYKRIDGIIEGCELGIRALSIIYDEHSDDQKSKDNILRLKDNLYYKLSSIRFNFKLLLIENHQAEEFCKKMTEKDPSKFNGFIMGNPYFQRIERDISSIFDNIIYAGISIFDYLAHMICYIVKSNKQKTEYWTKVARMSRSKNTEIGRSTISNVIDLVDREFAGKLYDYRSRLLHNSRDLHKFHATHKLMQDDWEVKILVSDNFRSKRYMKSIELINDSYNDFTLPFVTTWLIDKIDASIESIVDGLVTHIKGNSFLKENLYSQNKGKMLRIGTFEGPNRSFIPIGDILYRQYKETKNSPNTAATPTG